MGATVSCFQGLKIEKCSCTPGSWSCCAKKEPDGNASTTKPQPAHVMIIEDVSIDLCVVSAPHRYLQSLGEPNDNPDQRWDFITVDKDKNMIMIAGDRFNHFCINPELVVTVDTCRGKPLADVFPRSITDVLNPLLDIAIQGTSGQLHTIYKSHSLTMFAYPIRNERGDSVGAYLIYRPTKYNQADIAKLISRGGAMSSGGLSGSNNNAGLGKPSVIPAPTLPGPSA